MTGSVALSALLIIGAQYYVSPKTAQYSTLTAEQQSGYTDPNWERTLEEVQNSAAIASPQAADPEVVDQFKAAAKTDNVTDSVARTLFVSLSDAQSQGLGGDLPTQDKLIAEAAAQLQLQKPVGYSRTDLIPSTDTKDAKKRWANAVMSAIIAHPAASRDATYAAIGQATDANDKTKLSPLKTIAAAYRAIADDIALIPVPSTLAPLDLQIINTFVAIAATYPDMAAIGSDPLRGLAALQNFNAYIAQQGRLFTNVAQELAKNGILFDKGEPGATWSAYIPTTQ